MCLGQWVSDGRKQVIKILMAGLSLFDERDEEVSGKTGYGTFS